jgi:hypothetical protein
MTAPIDRVAALVALATDPAASENEKRNAALAACEIVKKEGLAVDSPTDPYGFQRMFQPAIEHGIEVGALKGEIALLHGEIARLRGAHADALARFWRHIEERRQKLDEALRDRDLWRAKARRLAASRKETSS